MDYKLAQPVLSSRYASSQMSYLFSPYHKHLVWKKLWVALAKAQNQLGLNVTLEQISELEKNLFEIDFEKAKKYEKEFRHDVMAHIHAYGDLCPKAKSIIHLGATSCFVTDNADAVIIKEGLDLLLQKLSLVIEQLSFFADKHKGLACLGYTHFQSAQPTTVGKRASLWLQDFLLDAEDIKEAACKIKLLGAKGATGTQASFLSLFNKDEGKVEKLEKLIASQMGIDNVFAVSGQTYSRKQDLRVLSTLIGLATSAHKMATDIRLLSHLKEVNEPFAEKQVGSSAMPYKKNPMLSERICGIARYLISLGENPAYTAATQWLERSLDDSSNRRLYMPEAFLAADAILNVLVKLTKALQVNPAIIQKNLQEELPFFATENILMNAVKKGGDRQVLHEKLREYTLKATALRSEGKEHALLTEIMKDKAFQLEEKELEEILNPLSYIGRAVKQVELFIEKEINPFLHNSPPYKEEIVFADL